MTSRNKRSTFAYPSENYIPDNEIKLNLTRKNNFMKNGASTYDLLDRSNE